MGSTTRGLVRGFCAAQLRARFAVGGAVGGPGDKWRGGREKSIVECCRQKCYVAGEGLSWPAVQTGPGEGMGCTSWYEMGDVVRASRFLFCLVWNNVGRVVLGVGICLHGHSHASALFFIGASKKATCERCDTYMILNFARNFRKRGFS